MAKLTAVQIRNAKAKDKPYKIADGHGLFLHVATSGEKTWRYRYRLDGAESTFTIGEYPMMTLEQARAERVNVREMVKAGVNPAQERRERKQEVVEQGREARKKQEHSFEAVALDWIAKSILVRLPYNRRS